MSTPEVPVVLRPVVAALLPVFPERLSALEFAADTAEAFLPFTLLATAEEPVVVLLPYL